MYWVRQATDATKLGVLNAVGVQGELLHKTAIVCFASQPCAAIICTVILNGCNLPALNQKDEPRTVSKAA
jgi:hypothetical protein